MTIFLTIEEVLEVHRQVIEETGGSEGVRDVGLLDSAIHRPRASFGGVPFYPDLCRQAAALLHSLIANHPFIDGNKRTAFTAMDVFLRRNASRLEASHDDKINMALAAAASTLTFEQIVAWIENHSKPA